MTGASASPASSGPNVHGFDLRRLGGSGWAAILALVLIAVGLVALSDAYGMRHGLLWLTGAALGVSLYHASFGFTAAYRVFIADRKSAGLRGQMLLLSLAVVLMFPVLAAGDAFGQPVGGFVFPVGVSLVVGAFIFGIGMQLGGGCASGTLFAIGGGSTRMLVTLLFFIIGSTVAASHLHWWYSLPTLPAVSLIDAWGLLPALAANLSIFAAIAWLVARSEKRTHGSLAPLFTSAKGRTTVLRGPWPLAWGAVALALLSFVTLLLAGRPWGVSSAFALWGSQAMVATGLGDPAAWPYWQWQAEALNTSLLADVTSIMDLGIIVGALLAAGLAGKFAPVWRIPLPSLLGAIVGGLMLGYGARLAFGCNIGAFFSGIASGSPHGWVWIACALPGTWLGVRLRPLFALPVERTIRGSC